MGHTRYSLKIGEFSINYIPDNIMGHSHILNTYFKKYNIAALPLLFLIVGHTGQLLAKPIFSGDKNVLDKTGR